MDSLPFHPAIIHFPISLFIMSAILGIISLFTERIFIKRMIFWLFIAAIIFTVTAIISGYIAANSMVHNEAIHEILEKHESNAWITTGYFLILFLWFWIRKKIVNKYEYLVWVLLLVGGTVLLGYQNYLGGKMVYEQGAAVKPMEKIIKESSHHEHNHSENKE